MTDPTSNSLDRDAIRERYRLERERRTPADNERRYRDTSGALSKYEADPYANRTPRLPLVDDVDVLIVGGGFGGLLTAARLREAGVQRVRIVEAGSDVGGAWYWNRYPGAACDVESYIYFPLLEETGYMPVERYSKAAEIRGHCQRIAEHFGLYEHALFSTRVTALDWDEDAKGWIVSTDRNDRIRARFVVLTTGPLNKPKLPAIPGIETFAGHSFHTSRWDYDYTGGSPTDPLAGLADKRVGVIGTGATAIQCVPPLSRSAEHLYVFQRTPSYVAARNNAPTDPAWTATLEPGWQQRRMDNFTAQFFGQLQSDDLVQDGWTELARAVKARLAVEPDPDLGRLMEEEDLALVARVRDRIAGIVKDPAAAEALQPWFSLFCKRPCFHDEYLAAFNAPNVDLIDTKGRGVEAITPAGVVVDGVEHPLDCLIFATGFDVASDLATRSGLTMRGRGGLALGEKWAGGMSTLHGLQTRDFPNCFIISQAQSGMSVNFPHMLNEQARHTAHVIAHCLQQGLQTVEPALEAERDWTRTIVQMSSGRHHLLEACTPGYYNNEGRASQAAAASASYGAGPVAFLELLRGWRDRGDFVGLEFNRRQHTVKEEVGA